MRSTRATLLISATVFFAALIGVALIADSVNTRRPQPAMALDADTAGALPPWVTLSTTALGSFRGVLVDALWYRARVLQDDGQFFEANQLSQWITTLQPRFPQVWFFQAWNMAYNISVATYTPEERWDWVSKGIALLRDKGIVYNPTAIKLYRELGWFYFHKIGLFMDDMHWYYKYRLALEWQLVLGAPPPDADTPQTIDWFKPIADAPDSLDRLIEKTPSVQSLLLRLKWIGYQPDTALLQQINAVRLYEPWLAGPTSGAPLQASAADLPYDAQLASVLADTRSAEPFEAMYAFLRKAALRGRYHMDPAYMLGLMQRYGPLDWRHPASHGLYWSELGVTLAGEIEGSSLEPDDGQPKVHEIDLLNTNRQSLHAIQQLSRFGRVSLDPVSQRVDLMPDPRFAPVYDKALDTAKQRLDSGQFGQVEQDMFAMGHENFLLEATVHHYLYGDADQAREFFDKARRFYGDSRTNIESGRYRQPLAQLVADQLSKHLSTMSDTNQFISEMLYRAFQHGLAQGNPETFNRFIELASDAHRRYQQDKDVQAIAPGQGRLRLPPFNQMLTDAFSAYMRSAGVSVQLRSRVWTATPIRLRQRVYARLRPVLERQAREAGFDPALAFPQPPGYSPDAPPPSESDEDSPDQQPVRIETQ